MSETEQAREPERERTRVAAYALTTDPAGRVLLCRTAPGVVPEPVWLLPGEFGEAPEDAVLRELTEETGLTGEVECLLDVHDRVIERPDEAGRVHAIRIIYRVHVSGGELRDEADGSTDTCAWVDPEEAATLHLGDLARRALGLIDA
jgi:8-oxo-dGTP diphosphatase